MSILSERETVWSEGFDDASENIEIQSLSKDFYSFFKNPIDNLYAMGYSLAKGGYTSTQPTKTNTGGHWL